MKKISKFYPDCEIDLGRYALWIKIKNDDDSLKILKKLKQILGGNIQSFGFAFGDYEEFLVELEKI